MVATSLTQGPSPLPPPVRELYPFDHRYYQLPEGERMHYIDEGTGPVVLMLHGNPTWSFMYRNLVRHLSAQGYRCIAPDHIGMGLSDKPQQYTYTLARHMRNVRLLLGALGITSYNLVAHDWGGAIGMGVATEAPVQVGRIVLMNTAAFLGGPMPRRIAACRVPGLGSVLIRRFNAFAAGATRMAVQKPLPAQVRQGYVFPYGDWKNRVATLRFVQDIPLNQADASYETLLETERRLPTLANRNILLAWGMRDWCFSVPFLRRWREIYPDAHCAAYPNAGHYLLEDAGQRVIEEIGRFLAGTPGTITQRGC